MLNELSSWQWSLSNGLGEFTVTRVPGCQGGLRKKPRQTPTGQCVLAETSNFIDSI